MSSSLADGPVNLVTHEHVRSGPAGLPGSAASQWDQGANSASNELRRANAPLVHADPTTPAGHRLLALGFASSTWTDFSASANVSGDTSGPTWRRSGGGRCAPRQLPCRFLLVARSNSDPEKAKGAVGQELPA